MDRASRLFHHIAVIFTIFLRTSQMLALEMTARRARMRLPPFRSWMPTARPFSMMIWDMWIDEEMI
jgi:hypothetical protein